MNPSKINSPTDETTTESPEPTAEQTGKCQHCHNPITRANDRAAWADPDSDDPTECDDNPEDCDGCDGNGSAEVDCDTCEGTGQIGCEPCEGPEAMSECTDCDGDGTASGNCEDCDGEGGWLGPHVPEAA